MKNHKKENLKDSVMKEIHKDKVKMRPHFYFVLGSALLALGMMLAFMAAVLLTNLSTFQMRLHKPIDFLQFGQYGIRPFLSTFPWLLIILTLAAIACGILLLKKYDISYKRNFTLLVVWLVVLALGAGFLLDQIGFSERAEKIKQIQSLYKAKDIDQYWMVGEVTQIKDNKIIVTTPTGLEVSVSIDDQTMMIESQQLLLGDKVKIVGQKDNGSFQAKGIKRGCPVCEYLKARNKSCLSCRINVPK